MKLNPKCLTNYLPENNFQIFRTRLGHSIQADYNFRMNIQFVSRNSPRKSAPKFETL